MYDIEDGQSPGRRAAGKHPQPQRGVGLRSCRRRLMARPHARHHVEPEPERRAPELPPDGHPAAVDGDLDRSGLYYTIYSILYSILYNLYYPGAGDGDLARSGCFRGPAGASAAGARAGNYNVCIYIYIYIYVYIYIYMYR